MREIKKRKIHPHCSAALTYAKEVAVGKIPACEYTVLACKRFLADLERGGRYIFNRDRAERFCDFVELMPHVKGKWAGQSMKLEPWQSFIFANLFGFEDKETGLRRFRRAFVFVPRKNGKTTLSAPLALGMLTIEAEPGSEIYCLAPSTPILFGDFVWRPLSEVEVGDKLIGFDENSPDARKYRKYRPSNVEEKRFIHRPCMRITFDDGGSVISSVEHKWLTPHTGGGNPTGWKQTKDLRVGNKIRYFGEPWGKPLESFEAGYVSGFFDSEGCIGSGWNKKRAGFRLSASQRENVVLSTVKETLTKYGVAFSPDRLCKQNDTIRFDIQSAYECFRFLGLFQPKRLIERSEQLYNGRSFNKKQKWRKIQSVEDVGIQEVVAIKTTTGTFIADGLCSHNCGATSEAQADEVFRPAKAMADRAQGFKKTFGLTVAASCIHRDFGLSFFKRLIGKPGEGQSPYCAIHDEYHEHKTSEQVDSMDTGMGARQEPLQFIITTAGTDTSSPCKDMYDYAVKVLEGHFENESFFALIYGVDVHDDWTDYDTWKKANPNLGVSISDEYLRGKLAEAIQRTTLQNTVKTKHLNVWCNVGIGWINSAKWQANANPLIRMADFAGCKAWIGIDLASKVDLTAMMVLIFHQGRFYLFGKYYLPTETVELKGNEHYQKWAAEGRLVATPGARTDYAYLEADLQEIYNRIEIQEIVYDPREAEYLMQSIRENVSCPVVEMTQSAASLSEPMKEFEALYLSGNLIHDGDPVLAWAASNVVLKESRNKLYYPAKERPENKIDPMVAAVMAMARAKAGIEGLATQGFVEL